MSSEDQNQTTSVLAGLSVQSRILPFWREYPSIWFIQFEAVIEPLHKSDQQKYQYLLQQLQTQDLRHVTDILKNPPETKLYDTLKKRLITVYEESEVQNYQKLTGGIQLGDQKPTQLLRHMRELGSDMVTENGLKIEWMRQLPSHVRSVLSVNVEASLDTLASMADRMLEYETPINAGVAAITSPPSVPSQIIQDPKTEALCTQIDKLAQEIAVLNRTQSYRRNTYRSNSYGRQNRTRSSSKYRQTIDYQGKCWYHFTFGKNARRCEPPCSFNQESTGNQRKHQ